MAGPGRRLVQFPDEVVGRMGSHQAPDGLVGLDINVQVVEIIDAARQSVQSGKAVALK